jgi:putative ABC transport system permease protein
MNHKLLSYLIGILLLFSSMLIIYQGDYVAKVEKAQTEYHIESKYYPFKIPQDITTKEEYKKVLNDLDFASKKTNIGYLKRTRYSGWKKKQGRIDYNQEIQRVSFQVSNTKTTNIWQHFKVKGLVHGSTIKEKLPGYQVKVESIYSTLNNPSKREGTYFIETNNPAKINAFFKVLASRMHRNDIDDFKIADQDQIPQVEFEAPSQTELLLKIVLGFLILFIIIFQLTSTAKLSVFFLNGISTIKSFFLLFGKVWLCSGISVILLDFMMKYGWGWSFRINSVLVQLMLFSSIPLIQCTLIDIVKSLNLKNQIHHKNHNMMMILTLYIVKGLAMTGCFFALIPLTQVALNLYSNMQLTPHVEMQKQYGVFYPAVIGNNIGEHTLDDGKKLDDALYEPFNQRGALVIDDSDIDQPIQNYLKFIKVNPNYLKRFPLYDISGDRIRVRNDEARAILCVPVTRKQYDKQLINYINESSKDELGKKIKIKIIYTQPQKNPQFINFNNGKKINNETIFVTTSNNSSFVERNIMDGQGTADGLKIPIINSTESTYNTWRKELQKNNYIDNYPQLVKQADVPKEILKLSLGNVYSEGLIIGLSLLILLVLSSYVTLLFFSISKYKLILLKLHGYTKLIAYKTLWLLLLVQYSGMLLYLFSIGKLDIQSVLILIGLLMLEIVISVLTMRHLESKNMGDVLNGE